MAKNKSKKTAKKRQTGTTPVANTSSRSITRKRREERQKQKRRNQQVMVASLIIVAIVVAFIAFFFVTQPADAPVPDGTIERYAGIPQGFTEEGYARLGDPNAPIRVEEFSSFSCPSCQIFWESSMDGLVELVRDGKISFTFIPMTIGELANAGGAQSAALCAGDQDMFFEYHDMLFDWHTRHGNRAFSSNRLNSGAEELGLNTGAFNSCLGSNNDIIDAGIAESVDRGVTGTPSTFINGVAVASDINIITSAVNEAIQNLGVVPIPLQSDGGDEIEPEATADVVPDATDEATEEISETTPEADEPVEMTEEAEVTEEAPSEDGDS